MRMQILSHAGLLVESKGMSMVCDPWVIGSCYWRSWWNYPPVSKELIGSLNPDYVYLTHIHWDHFQGPSLRRIAKGKKIVIPKSTSPRIYKDLVDMGFSDILELRHSEKLNLQKNFSITSYQFSPFLDSAVVIEAEGVKILNLNDAKFMGLPLSQIIEKHGSFDFVLRSHSSANSRLSYELIDEPINTADDLEYYIENFSETVQSVPAKYCVPFASNQCHLHPEVMRFNSKARTPEIVRDFFEKNKIKAPQLKVMVSGDSWSTQNGFRLGGEQDYYSNREKRQKEYADTVKEKLDKQEVLEKKAVINTKRIRKYFNELTKIMPFFLRRLFKNKAFVYVLSTGDSVTNLYVDLYLNQVKIIDTISDEENPRQIHTAAFIFNRCISLHLFSHLTISKRVTLRVTKKEKKYIELLHLVYNCYEYDLIPIKNIFTLRFISNWITRWREILLYFSLLKDRMLTGTFNFSRYLPKRAYDRELRAEVPDNNSTNAPLI